MIQMDKKIDQIKAKIRQYSYRQEDVAERR